ncbi:hypothetical protein B0T26DRAFT_297335 [Lasiosphaeria miniovina]|uniref:Uncharacterized protein n=1 Tax=Lasiosphaeria miniovina TaxID=1954250 RepID=A0AA40AKD1_9PEZI|nr:uncharacterized protein B0T26DRAFT_297335 [Lasiosphaeria miniovina]KAK0717474.1 hypothetical protein B0T26DRAFT_297335 [Lasiosphaeria miniovina]
MSIPLEIRKIERYYEGDDLYLSWGFGTDKKFPVKENDHAIFPAKRQDFMGASETGKSLPAIFMYNKQGSTETRFPISVTGKIAFPAGAKFKLQGTMGHFLVQSATFDRPAATENGVFTADNFKHVIGQSSRADSPFKVEGDWAWEVLSESSGAPISAKTTTPLELYFALGLDATKSKQAAARAYYTELVRFCFPKYDDIHEKAWADVEMNVLKNTIYALWDHGGTNLQYDCLYVNNGACSHFFNKDLRLETILRRTIHTVNCYDLAALTMTTFQSLGNRPSTDATKPAPVPVVNKLRLKVMNPWGYIKLCRLFGHTNACNNPFWKGRFAPHPNPFRGDRRDADPVVEKMDIHRTYFGNHCFVVFRDRRGEEMALDNCCGLLGELSKILLAVGTLNARAYKATSTEDGARTADIALRPNSDDNPMAELKTVSG